MPRQREFQQIILIGGDAALGHFFYPHLLPVTEQQKHSAYPGCYALSKVLEEVMLEQYFIQYDLSGCCLRAPWIMEKDDFKYSLSFGEDVFGGPRWRDLVGPERADEYVKSGAVPLMLDPERQAGEAQFRPRQRPGRKPSCWPSTIPKPASRLSTFAWTSRWTISRWRTTCARRGAAFGRDRNSVLVHLAGQHQSEIPAGMETAG